MFYSTTSIKSAMKSISNEIDRISSFSKILLLCEPILDNYNYKLTLENSLIQIDFDRMQYFYKSSIRIKFYISQSNEISICNNDDIWKVIQITDSDNELLNLIKMYKILTIDEQIIQDIIR